MLVKAILWEHQKQMVQFGLDRLNSDEVVTVGNTHIHPKMLWWLAGCSTGKTLAAYKIAEIMGFKKTLVITTKAGATAAWLKDANKHLENVTVVAPVGNDLKLKKNSLRAKFEGTFIYVMNYESAWRLGKELMEFGFDFIVADESHKAKANTSAQSKGLAEIAARIPYKLAMTGTGFDDRPTDVYGQVRYLDPVRLPRVGWSSQILGKYTDFFDHYTNYYVHDNIKIPKGYKNQDELREILNPFTLYVDSELVLDLPKVLDIERIVPMNKAIRTAYQDMGNNFLVRMEHEVVTADSILEQGLRLHQITSGYLPNGVGEATAIVADKENPKLQATLEILDELGGKPVVIFTRFREDVRILQRNLESNGYSVRLLTGSVNQQMEWQYEGQGQVLIANIQAGGEAVDLTRARYCIYYSIGHSRSSFVQSLARIRRVGADLDHPVTYYHLMMENSVDLLIREAMTHKGEFADYLKSGITNRTT